MSEENKAVVQRMYEDIVNTGNMDLCEELIAPDVIEHEKIPGVADGIEGFK